MQYEVIVKTLLEDFSISSKCLMPVGRIIENLVYLPSGDIQLENSDAFCTYCEDDDCPIIKFMPTSKDSKQIKGTTNIVLNIGKLPINILEVPKNCPLTPEVFINNGALELTNRWGEDEIIDPKDENPEVLKRFTAQALFDSNFVLMPASARSKCAFCNLGCELNPGFENLPKTQNENENNKGNFTNQ